MSTSDICRICRRRPKRARFLLSRSGEERAGLVCENSGYRTLRNPGYRTVPRLFLDSPNHPLITYDWLFGPLGPIVYLGYDCWAGLQGLEVALEDRLIGVGVPGAVGQVLALDHRHHGDGHHQLGGIEHDCHCNFSFVSEPMTGDWPWLWCSAPRARLGEKRDAP